MRTFTNEKTISQVTRLSYVGNKGTRSVVMNNIGCYLRPLSEEQAAVNGMQWGQGYTIITEIASGIQVGDVVTISSQDYTIRGLAVHDRGGITAYNKYLASLPQS